MSDEEMQALVVRAKAALRKRLRALRQTTPASACAKRSERLVEQLLAMDVVAAAKRVALFWPIEGRHEVDLRRLDHTLRARAVEVAYPSIDPLTGVMTFRVAEAVTLVEDELGFRGAPASAPELTSLDVIVVPAIALDSQGRRLGYGAGFYDRALADQTAVTIGVAYDFQLLAEVPSSPTDVPVHWVVTDTRVLNCAEEAL